MDAYLRIKHKTDFVVDEFQFSEMANCSLVRLAEVIPDVSLIEPYQRSTTSDSNGYMCVDLKLRLTTRQIDKAKLVNNASLEEIINDFDAVDCLLILNGGNSTIRNYYAMLVIE